MKRICLISLCYLVTMVWSIDLSYSRGGFGGGRGGFGGAEFRGGGFGGESGYRGHMGAERRGERTRQPETRQRDRVKRPVSESRPGKVGTVGNASLGDAQNKPTRENLQKFLNLPAQTESGLSSLGKVGAIGAAGALGAMGVQHLMEKPGGGDRPQRGDRPARLDRDLGKDGRPDSWASNRDRVNADQIRQNVKNRYDNLFTPQWWADHPNLAHQYWENMGKYQYAWNHWWRPAAWGALAGWVAGTTWASPQYYDYSSGIYYEGDNVYENDAPVASAQDYYQQASKLAETPVDSTNQSDDLMPLGVFALSQVDSTSSNMFLQLAVDKQGTIKGTYYNTGAKTTRPVKGSVDKKTQRAAWSFADGKNTDMIMETGLYNLTLDQTEALVHFGQNKTQRWLMVRMEQPEQEKTKAAQNN